MIQENDFFGENYYEKKGVFDLARLGLSFDDLRGKQVLDVGAGAANIAKAARTHDISVTSLDKNPAMWMQEGIDISGLPYIQGDAEHLPFENETYDLLISHGGPYANVAHKESLIQMLNEALRVLRDGGELRIAPGFLNASLFEGEQLLTPEEDDAFTREQRIQRFSERAYTFLKQLVKNVEQRTIPDPESGEESTYFVIQKLKPVQKRGRVYATGMYEKLLDQAKMEEIRKTLGIEKQQPKGRSEDEIVKALESGSDEELNAIAHEFNLPAAQVDLFRHYAQLRKNTHSSMKRELDQRIAQEPRGTQEEKGLGLYREMIEPQVRQALFRLREKGYNTQQSGFGGPEGEQMIELSDDGFKDVRFTDAFMGRLSARGTTIDVTPKQITLKFAEKLPIEKLEEIWNIVEAEIPSIGIPAKKTNNHYFVFESRQA